MYCQRFIYEMPIYIKLARRSIQHAWAIVAHFYWAKARSDVHPLALAYVNGALRRYCRSQRRDIGKALGLVRSRRGNPGRVPSKKRRLTPDGFIEAGQAVLSLINRGKAEHEAVDFVSSNWQVTDRTVRKALAAERLARTWRPPRGNREFPE